MTTRTPAETISETETETDAGRTASIDRRFQSPYREKWHRPFREYSHKDFYSTTADDLFENLKPFGIWWDHCLEWGAYYHHEMPMLSAPDSRVSIQHPRRNRPSNNLINFASYNYLGLSYREEVIDAAVSAMRRYGLGSMGSPKLSGMMDVHRQLESDIARFMGQPAALLFPTGYGANLGVIAGLMRPEDTIVADQLAHASILDGARLAGIRPRFFRHNDATDLDRKLDKSTGRTLVVVEGVYSMEGDIGALNGIVDACGCHGARILIDEAHSAFLYGQNGRGVAEYLGVYENMDIIMGTTSESLGGSGGFITGSHDLIEYLRGYATPWIFSGGLPPAIAAGLIKSLEIVRTEPNLRAKLWTNTAHMQELLQEGGVDIGSSTSQVISIMIGHDWEIYPIADELFEQGVYISPIRYPAVAESRSRFRMAISAGHTESDIEHGAQIVISVLGKYGKLRRQAGSACERDSAAS